VALAACALPGVMPSAHAEDAPEQGIIALKFAAYDDRQPDQKRLTVHSPLVYALVPLGPHWAVEGSLLHDDVSGATPRYYTDVSGASHMSDSRVAGDFKVTRYFERQTLSLGVSHSSEHDYVSNAVSLAGSHASEDHNTTWNAGIGVSHDTINPVNEIVVDERRRSTELQVGVTQAISATDLVQATLTHSQGKGYYSDPYKLFDQRPRERSANIVLLRWNHWLSGDGGALKTSYRFYRDSFGISSHTASLEWARAWAEGLTLTPSLRYTTQRAADFYYDPVADLNVYPGPVGTPPYSSTDQRLAAFGAVGLGLRVDYDLAHLWHVDAKVERYEQRSDWRLGGQGSPGLAPLQATQWQLGLSRKF
jgi:hypothetical protein